MSSKNAGLHALDPRHKSGIGCAPLALDVLEGLRGGAGIERRRDPSENDYTGQAIMAVAKEAIDLKQSGMPPVVAKAVELSDKDAEKIQDKFREGADKQSHKDDGKVIQQSTSGDNTASAKWTKNLLEDEKGQVKKTAFDEESARRVKAVEAERDVYKALDAKHEVAKAAVDKAAQERNGAKTKLDSVTAANSDAARAFKYYTDESARHAKTMNMNLVAKTKLEASINAIKSDPNAKNPDVYEKAYAKNLMQAKNEYEKAAKAKTAADSHVRLLETGVKAIESAKSGLEKADGKLKDATAQAAKADADTVAVGKKVDELAQKATDAGLTKDARSDLQKLAKEEGWSKGVRLVNDVLTDVAKQAAKADGSYQESKSKTLRAGDGVTQTAVITSDGSTETTTKINQRVTESKTESYSSAYGAGASASTGIRAEAGHEVRNETTNANGTVDYTQTKTYVSAGAEAEAKASATWAKAQASGSASVSAHAEASATTGTKSDVGELKADVGASGHAEVKAKAGAAIGFDGVNAKASATAEAKVKVQAGGTGDLAGVAEGKIEAGVYAKAKAEATAGGSVNFNPFAPGERLGAKGGLTLEAGAGVGVEGKVEVGGKTAGIGAEGGLHVGKIGAKVDVDVGYKDGKVNLDLDVGAALGVGLSLKINAKLDVVDACNGAANGIKAAGEGVAKAANAVGNTIAKLKFW